MGKLWGIARAMKGGIGTASISAAGFTVGALVAVNALGDVIDPATGEPVAGARSADGRHLLRSAAALQRGELPESPRPGLATTIGVVATDAQLTQAQAHRMATMAHDGLGIPSFSPNGKRMSQSALRGEKWFMIIDGKEEAEWDEIFVFTK